MHDCVIRGFRAEDLEGVHRLIHETIDACYPEAYPPRAVAYFKQFHSREKIAERARAGTLLVAVRDGKIVGTGARVGGEIFGVFVRPGMQRSGCGRALMLELERGARAEGIAEIELSVSLPSRGFYEGLGYMVQQERSIDVGAGECLRYWDASKELMPGSVVTE